jgi:serine protein kinase
MPGYTQDQKEDTRHNQPMAQILPCDHCILHNLEALLMEGMRSIEDKVKVPESGKEAFRSEIFRKVAMAQRGGEHFDYTTHEKLKEAIKKQLFEERRDTIKLTVSTRNPDPDQLRKINEVVDTLVRKEGYCAECANELLRYVSSLLAREK